MTHYDAHTLNPSAAPIQAPVPSVTVDVCSLRSESQAHKPAYAYNNPTQARATPFSMERYLNEPSQHGGPTYGLIHTDLDHQSRVKALASALSSYESKIQDTNSNNDNWTTTLGLELQWGPETMYHEFIKLLYFLKIIYSAVPL